MSQLPPTATWYLQPMNRKWIWPSLSSLGGKVLFPPNSVGAQVCDVPGSFGPLVVTCLMVSWLICIVHEESVWVVDEASISWGKLSIRPIMASFFYQKCLFPGTKTSLNWEGVVPK